jgi:hypothetical protein
MQITIGSEIEEKSGVVLCGTMWMEGFQEQKS